MRQLISAAVLAGAVPLFWWVSPSIPALQPLLAWRSPAGGRHQQPAGDPASGERHLRNVRKLTSGGENAEAYFSADGTRLIFQATRAGYPCDQIYTMRLDGSEQKRISTGTGRTTCGYFYPAGDEILFASTHEGG